MALLINFVSNLPPDLRSGGFSAMNAAALEALCKTHAVHYVGPINPPVATWRKGLSKAMRLMALGGAFSTFSSARLTAIAAEARRLSRPDADLDFFHGFTPWVALQPGHAYVAWSDCTFRDYMTIYHRREAFNSADLARIETAEAAWMKGARTVAFTSTWAADRAIADYDLDPARVKVVGIFGETEPPAADVYGGAPQFAFISTDFAAKGGPLVVEAFRAVRAARSDVRLVVVGDSPPGLDKEPGVIVAGFLRKEDPAQNRRLRDILASSRGVVHPTRSDIAPLLLVEAGYFGCPVIASRRFAIPEIVEDGHTGVLLDNPTAAALAEAMKQMLAEDATYLTMRRAAWGRARERHSKARFEERLLACLETAA